jgi:hypothetical protein
MASGRNERGYQLAVAADRKERRHHLVIAGDRRERSNLILFYEIATSLRSSR